MSEGPDVPVIRLMRRLQRPERPVDAQSVALFRLGEQCNNDCPMCSNSGREEAFFQSTEELVSRVRFLAREGFRRVVVTGGEPTIHPGFWEIIAALGEYDIAWDINTHGRTFADEAFTTRAREAGLERAIVSLHSHIEEASCVISGVKSRGHQEAVTGIDRLVGSGAYVLVNLVVTTHNADHLQDFASFCWDRWGPAARLKIAFPSTTGKGGDWDGIQLRYSDVQDEVRATRTQAKSLGQEICFESFPNCVLGSRKSRNMGRSGFGETHYLDDITGRDVYPIQYIESVLSVFPETCKRCRAVDLCPGVSDTYLRRVGASELVPL